MAPLPPSRLAVYMKAFTYVVKRSAVKRWDVLITCMTTRAIHLEVAHSMDTSSCIMAIQNFIGRRGRPKELYSDNGTNFHGANNTLKQEFEKLNKDQIQEEFTTSEMTWAFNPAKASHMGGCWERMIGIDKKCLDEGMTTRHLTDEMLVNLFIETETTGELFKQWLINSGVHLF